MPEAAHAVDLRESAWRAARAAGHAHGVTVREVGEPDELRDVEILLRDIWKTGAATPPMPGDILRMLSYTGAYVAGAYASDTLIGAAVGFLTDAKPAVGGPHLHSHIAGVAAGYRGRQVGFALKLHQRAWALERGFDRVTWTFDPLVRRNAYFNLTKLRARVSHYLVDFYGAMPDGLNVGQGSDRILVDWLLRSPEVEDAAHGRVVADDVPEASATRVVLQCTEAQLPQPRDVAGPGPVRCEIPADVESLRRIDPDLGRAWRSAVRAVLQPALTAGGRVVAFDRRAGYVLDLGSGAP